MYGLYINQQTLPKENQNDLNEMRQKPQFI